MHHAPRSVLVLLLTVAMFAMPYLHAADSVSPATTCRPHATADLDLEPSARFLPLVPARVNHQDVWLKFSLASGYPTVRAGALRTLGIETRHIPGQEFKSGRNRVRDYARLEPVQFGDHTFEFWDALVIPDSEDSEVEWQADRVVLGTMGSQIMPVVDLELDLANGKLRLFKPHGCTDAPVYWTTTYSVLPFRFDRSGTLIVTVELDGRRVDATLSPGNERSTMDIMAARRYFGFKDGESAATDKPIYYSMSLTGVGVEIRDAPVVLRSTTGECRPTPATSLPDAPIRYLQCSNSAPVTLGNDLLSQLRLYFSSADRKVYVSRSSTSP
jgi:hypothetical protein